MKKFLTQYFLCAYLDNKYVKDKHIAAQHIIKLKCSDVIGRAFNYEWILIRLMILNLDSNSFLFWTQNLYLFYVWLVKTMTSQTTFFLIISLVKQVLQIQSFCFLSSYSIFGHSLSSINYLYLEYTTHTKFLKKCQQNIHS